MDEATFEQKLDEAARVYGAAPSIRSPYFKGDIAMTWDGFQHLRKGSQGERRREDQALRFTLLPLGIHVLKTATTVQEYRMKVEPGSKDKPHRKDRLVQWWTFLATFVDQRLKIKVIVRKVGDGKVHFWSVMLCPKHEGDRNPKRLRSRKVRAPES